jgi:hypothetical protein
LPPPKILSPSFQYRINDFKSGRTQNEFFVR